MANYPGALDTFSTHADGVSETITAAHINNVQGATLAVQTELGLNPSGSETDVLTRLNKWLNPNKIAIDSFNAGSDEANFTAALSYLGAQTYPPILTFQPRLYSMTASHDVFQGLRMMGGEGASNAERSGAGSTTTAIDIALGGTSGTPKYWLNVNSGTFIAGVFMQGFAIKGHQYQGFCGVTTGSANYWVIRDMSFTNCNSVFGSQATKLSMTACVLDGWWDINNCYTGALHLGGSDNTFFTNGCLLDSGTAFNTAGSSNGQYHFWADSLEKTYVGPMYITAEGAWNGIRVTGNSYNSRTSTTLNNGSTLTLPAGTITVASAASFTSTGTIQVWSVVSGVPALQTITYTGKTGTTFTGCTGGTGTVPDTTPIEQAYSTNLGGPLIFDGLRLEGRNAGAPCNGALIRWEGGYGSLINSWLSYGMWSPSTPGHSPADAGVVHVETGARVVMDSCTYDRAGTMLETVPFIYCNTGAKVRVTNQYVGWKGGVWAGLPRAKDVAGVATNVTADSTVTVI